jgi:flagellin
MTFSVATNLSALNAQNQIRQNQTALSTSFQRIASGQRINSAKDDAAGLQISTRMEAEIRGVTAAKKNTNDGISLLQTMDGALGEVVNLLQRARELAVQSENDTNSKSDREALQAEYSQILDQVDEINTSTNFNQKQVFSQGKYAAAAEDPLKRDVITGLKSYWLKEAEDRIKTYYGIDGSGKTLDVQIGSIDGAGGTLAQVSYNATSRTMLVDLDDFNPANLPNGGESPYYADRVIAHEMVHAVVAASTNFTSVPTWFNEGMAEFIHGADVRVVGDGGAGVVAGGSIGAAWGGTSADYSRAYIATRYLHQKIKDLGGEGVKDVLEYMAADTTRTFDQAIASASKGTYANTADFVTDYEANKAAFAATLDLTNEDTGAIGGYDADGGDVLRDEDIFKNDSTLGQDPLSSFLEKFDASTNFDPTAKQGGKLTRLNIDGKGTSLDFYVGSFNQHALGLSDTNMVEDGNRVISYVDDALNYINGFRSKLGAIHNRLESTINSLDVQALTQSASKSQILDADFAVETATLSKNQIIQQAATSILAQSNISPSLALKLL